MTLKQLRYVTVIADTGNITEAAKRLFIAQPSLTSAVQELEKEYGITLFENPKTFELTDQGKVMLEYAKKSNHTCIDLNKLSLDYYNKIGEEKSKKFHISERGWKVSEAKLFPI